MSARFHGAGVKRVWQGTSGGEGSSDGQGGWLRSLPHGAKAATAAAESLNVCQDFIVSATVQAQRADAEQQPLQLCITRCLQSFSGWPKHRFRGKLVYMQIPSPCLRTLRLKVRAESCGWLDAAAVEVNQVFNFCVRREVASSIVAAIATDSPMSRTLGGHAELVTARYEAPLTMYLRAIGRRRELVRVNAVLAASSR